MAIIQPEKKGGGGLSKLTGVVKLVGGIATGNPKDIAEGVGGMAPEGSPASQVGQAVGSMGRRLDEKTEGPISGDGKAGPMPGVSGSPFSRRIKPIAGPEFY